MEFVRVSVAGKPEDQTFVIARRDVDPAMHTIVEERVAMPGAASATPPPAAAAAPASRFVRVTIKGKPGDQVFVLAARDVDPSLHDVLDATAPLERPAPLSVPAIADMNVAAAVALVESIEEVPLLQALREAEEKNPRYAGGRKTVIDAIDARLKP